MQAFMSRLVPVSASMFLVIWLTLLAGGQSRLLRDPGTLWHTVVGQRIWAQGELIRTDPFSFRHAGQPWIAMQWVGECLMAAVHAIAGIDGLLLLTATVLAGLYAWLGARLCRRGCHWLPAAAIVGLAMYSSAFHFHCRPHLGTMLFLGLTCAWLADVEAGRRPLVWLIGLIPLCILWTNVHAGVLGGIATVVLVFAGWSAECLLFRDRDSTSRGGPERGSSILPLGTQSRDRTSLTDCESTGSITAVAGAESSPEPHLSWPALRSTAPIVPRQIPLLALLATACAGTILVNPYGVALPRVWLALNDSKVLPAVIEEHAPWNPANPEELGLALFAGLYLVGLVGVLPRRPRVTWVIPLAWLVLSLGRVRHGPLFAIAATIALAELLPYTWYVRWLTRRGSDLFVPPDLPRPLPHAGDAALVPTVVVCLALALKAIGIPAPVLGAGWARLASETFPTDLVTALEEYQHTLDEPQPIFNELNFGGFVIYYAPRLRVFIDDRCELYGDAGLLEYVDALERHPERLDQWADEYRFELALVRNGSSFDRHLANANRWSLWQRAATAALYRRSVP